LVNNRVIIELKSVTQLVKAHEVQLVNYLTTTGKDIGLILNFGEKGVEVIRKIREPKRFSELLKKLVASNGSVNLVNPVNPVKIPSSIFSIILPSWHRCLNFIIFLPV
jgi:hypothetical protein